MAHGRMGLFALIFMLTRAFAEGDLADSPDALLIPWPDARLQVSGLAWFSEDRPELRRLPARLKDTFPPEVWGLAQNTSGGRIRFRTDSTRLYFKGGNPGTSRMHHMTTVGQSGLDLYVDGEYRGSTWPNDRGRIECEAVVGTQRAVREVTLYLPLYNGLNLESFRLDPGATLLPPAPFAIPKPVVYYGSSITQGGCAENTGLSYEAIVGRALNVDFVNLGFSGCGLGEPALAAAMAEIDAAAYVLDYWANPTAEVYRNTLPGFVDLLRRKHPETSILVVGPFWFPQEAISEETRKTQESKRRIAREFVEARKRAGDKAISWVDGLELLSRNHAAGLVDGVYPNSLGFEYCARGLEPHLRRVLGLPSGRSP
jgi:hypothetical protein